MVATVMRDNELKIENNLPANADVVEKLEKEQVMYIYAVSQRRIRRGLRI